MESILMFNDLRSFVMQLSERPKRDSNADICDAGAELYELSYQANWELVIMWAKMEVTIVGLHYVD